MYRINDKYAFFSHNFFMIRIIGAVCLVGIIVFLAVAFGSYFPQDPSWFFVSSDPLPIANKAGSVGASVAALLFYLFGAAAYLVFLPLLFGVLFLVGNRRFSQEWERLCACIYVVFVGSALLNKGIVGEFFAQKLIHYFDPVGSLVFLYVTLAASVVVVARFAGIVAVQLAIRAVKQVVFYCEQYQVVSRVSAGCMAAVRFVFIQVPVAIITFIKSVINGSAFDDTGLVVPEDEQTLFVSFDKLRTNGLEGHGSANGQEENNTVVYTASVLDTFSPVRPDSSTGSLVNAALSSSQDCSNPVRPELVEGNDGSDKFSSQVEGNKQTESKAPHYALPHADIFIAERNIHQDQDLEKELEARAHVLEDKLKRFGVTGTVVAIKRGPVVTLFEYQPDIDTKISKIIALEDDLAMALQAMSIRIIAPIPGKSVVGFEVANTHRNDVLFSQVVNSSIYKNFSGALPLVLGKGTIGEVVIVDLARMPHLLIAGSTGSGKSVALNALLISLLCKLDPEQLKLILIDPKRLEFAAFADIAHLLFPIITSPYQAAPVLRWVVQEMEDRYEKMAAYGARNFGDYNSRIALDIDGKALPAIVVVIDELADLMLTAGRDIEDLITRITQMARAAGIHMIVATQRPSVDVITGLIKANFPSRISFRVASRIDSRTILDTMGADRLLGRGDMLFLDASTSQLRRVHGAYVSDKEIESVVAHIKSQRKAEYLDIHQEISSHINDASTPDDALYQDVRLFLSEIDEVSISLLQRKFRIGYNRSARIIDQLESQGLIMPQDGGKTRKVIR